MQCPFCKATNGCQVAGECWCFVVQVPQSLLSLLAPQEVAKSCICQTCLKDYKSDPKAFTAAYNMRK